VEEQGIRITFIGFLLIVVIAMIVFLAFDHLLGNGGSNQNSKS
jgi:hypothetical protein